MILLHVIVQEVQAKTHMMYSTIKIIDLNPTVPEDQIYELLCEKFSNFSSASINIVQQDEDRIAYIYFKSYDDARAAMKENSCIVLFGYACRAVPVYDKPVNKRSGVTESSSGDYLENADDYQSDTFRKSEEDDERASAGESGHENSPQRRGFHSAPWLRRGGMRGRGRWQRGFSSAPVARARRSRPYLLTSGRSHRGQKPYLLTKRHDDDEQKPDVPLSPRSKDGQKPYLLTPLAASETTGEAADRDANSTLYVGSMDRSVKVIDLQRLFSNFGFVLHVEIRNAPAGTCFAFVHFLTMDMACLAKQEMAGKLIGHTVPKLGFGRNVETKCLWVGGLGPWTNEDMLHLEFGQFGEIVQVEWPRNRDYAYVLYANEQDAADAKQVMNGSHHGDPPNRLRICFASSVQMKSDLNHKAEFPKFPKKKIVPRLPKTRFLAKAKSDDRESQEPYWRRRRRSSERSRSRSPRRISSSPRREIRSPRRERRSSPHRKSRSHVRSRRKERTPSPYARSISQASSDNNMSAISETSSGSIGSSERSRQRKRHRKSSVSRSSLNKLLRNPSPPKSAVKDERTVVLRSEPQLVAGVSSATSDVYTSILNPLHAAPVPSYVAPVDPAAYYPSVASTLTPTMFPPPMHIPPPDFYMPPNPVVPQFPQHLPPLVSYPAVATDNRQPVPVVCQSNIPPIQTNTYVSSSVNTTPVKERQKSDSVGVATKFPKVWSGALVLRNAAFVVDFHLLSGSVLLVNSLLGSNIEPGSDVDCPVLKIAQRLRLDQPDKLDELDRRLKKAGRTGCSVLLATSTSAQVDDDANQVQQYPLSSLVSYLLQKQVAAVVSLPPGISDAAKAAGVLHAFPPCPYATSFLHREAPGLPTNCPTEEELLVVLCEF